MKKRTARCESLQDRFLKFINTTRNSGRHKSPPVADDQLREKLVYVTVAACKTNNLKGFTDVFRAEFYGGDALKHQLYQYVLLNNPDVLTDLQRYVSEAIYPVDNTTSKAIDTDDLQAAMDTFKREGNIGSDGLPCATDSWQVMLLMLLQRVGGGKPTCAESDAHAYGPLLAKFTKHRQSLAPDAANFTINDTNRMLFSHGNCKRTRASPNSDLRSAFIANVVTSGLDPSEGGSGVRANVLALPPPAYFKHDATAQRADMDAQIAKYRKKYTELKKLVKRKDAVLTSLTEKNHQYGVSVMQLTQCLLNTQQEPSSTQNGTAITLVATAPANSAGTPRHLWHVTRPLAYDPHTRSTSDSTTSDSDSSDSDTGSSSSDTDSSSSDLDATDDDCDYADDDKHDKSPGQFEIHPC